MSSLRFPRSLREALPAWRAIAIEGPYRRPGSFVAGVVYWVICVGAVLAAAIVVAWKE